MYQQESLNILSQLWNDKIGQPRDEDFKWQEIIENEKNKLLDEDELNHYAFRKDRLANMLEDDDSVALADRSRGWRGV